MECSAGPACLILELGRQSWTGKFVTRIDSPGPAAAGSGSLQATPELNLSASRQRPDEHFQAHAEGRQFENARITS